MYLRVFDVDRIDGQIQPVAEFKALDTLPDNVRIVPVVFIVNRVFGNTSTEELTLTASRLAKKVNDISISNHLKLASEIQIDCDWTASTKNAYFAFLETLRSQPSLRSSKISATIRLHQVKYRSQTGIPPVDRGMLMAYNMGNLQRPGNQNSILNTRDLKAYTGQLSSYPLPLDIALPMFDWFVWFRDDKFRGLIRTEDFPGYRTGFQISSDTIVGARQFRKDDVLRYEGVNANVLQNAAKIIAPKIKNDSIRVALYHLDARLLHQFNHEQIQTVYDSFR